MADRRERIAEALYKLWDGPGEWTADTYPSDETCEEAFKAADAVLAALEEERKPTMRESIEGQVSTDSLAWQKQNDYQPPAEWIEGTPAIHHVVPVPETDPRDPPVGGGSPEGRTNERGQYPEDVMALGIFEARFGQPGISDAAEADANAALSALEASGFRVVPVVPPAGQEAPVSRPDTT